jgi:hypothetical protein
LKVKPPKAGIVLIRVTFLALNVKCTLPPMVHPIIVEVFGGTGYFQPTMWELRRLPLGEKDEAVDFEGF